MKTPIPHCPIERPTWEEFKDFFTYVSAMQQKHKKHSGMVKIIPPPQWKSRADSYQKRLSNLTIKTAQLFTLEGKDQEYYFTCKSEQCKEISVQQYQNIAKMKAKQIAKLDLPEAIERYFWKIVPEIKKEVYCVNIPITLMDSTSGSWQFGKLKSLFTQAIKQKMPGLNSSLIFIGSWRTFFNWHIEDMDMSAINFVHQGATKVWYGVHPQDRKTFQSITKELFADQAALCPSFLRHKQNYINPYQLKEKYPQIRFEKMYQNQREISIVFSDAYHCGFNTGFNIAQAVNYATVSWMDKINNYEACKRECTKREGSNWHLNSAVTVENLTKSTVYNQIKNNPNFLKLKAFANKTLSKEMQIEEEFYQADSDQINRELRNRKKTKEIKKGLKSIYIPKFRRKFEIDSFVLCNKCKKWRAVSLKQYNKYCSDDSDFLCEFIGLTCTAPEQQNAKDNKQKTKKR